MMNIRRSLMVSATFVLLSSACSQKHGSASLPPLGQIPTITSAAQISRPIDAYVPNVNDVKDYDKALEILVNKCMQPFGLQAPTAVNYGLDESATKDKTATKLYGYFDPTADTSKGYDRVRFDDTPSSSSMSVAQQVEFGTDTSGQPVPAYNGKTIPQGGCHKIAQNELGGREPQPFVEALPGGGPTVPETDPRLKDANKQWSSCMARRGYKYTSPSSAFLDPRWIPAPGASPAEAAAFKHSSIEVATAQADIACKTSTNYMGTMIALESAYDNQYIASNKGQLSQFLAQLTTLRANVAHVVAAN